MTNQTIDGKLLSARTAISNSLNNPEISVSLVDFSYNQDKLNEGMNLLITAEVLQLAQKKEYGDQYAATDALTFSKAKANKPYVQHVKVARIVFKDNRSAIESLLLSGRRKSTFSGWINQAKTFYSNLLSNPELLDQFSKYVSMEKLKAGQTSVNIVETNYQKQLKEKGEAQDATVKRDYAFEALEDWMSDFIGIARIALEDQSQYLEVLGIVEAA